ncbi:MAG: hypothetical protein FJZ16_01125 [Candidatus Omnitrophica bacterium]|nr:hypothetical protein [Candidatus Omnitrophota bacterium]
MNGQNFFYRIVVVLLISIFFIDCLFRNISPRFDNNIAYAEESRGTPKSIVDLEELINTHPQLKGIDSIEGFLEFVSGYKTELSISSQRVAEEVLEKLDPKDKTAMRLSYMAVPQDSELFEVLTPFGKLPVKVYRINYKNRWQILMLINNSVNDPEYLRFALNRSIQFVIYLTRNELIKQRFPETRVFSLSTGAFLALGQFYYTIAIASAQYVSSFDSLMVDVVGWLTSGFPTGSRIRLLREVLPHEESHMRFFRLSKEEQDKVITSILNDLGKERIEEIYNTIGFWHEQANPDYFAAQKEMIKHPEWFEQDEVDMPGPKRVWILKLSNGKYLNLAIFITEFLSTLSMDLTALRNIYGIPQEFVNRLKALYDERQGIGFNLEKELSSDTKKLLRDHRLINPDISEHLSIISVQYPYLILEECWKGYFTDYDLEEVIGLSYAKKILVENGFDSDRIDTIKPIIQKYWLILTYQGKSLIVLEKIPTLSQWIILILASLYQKYPKDRAIEEIVNNLNKFSLNNVHLKSNIPLSILISKKGPGIAELNSSRARLLKEMMGDLDNIGFIRRLTKEAKDLDAPTLLSMTVLSKYICTVKTGGLISLRLALEEHIERALVEKGSLIIDLDLNTLLFFDKQGNPHLKDIYFIDAVNLLRSITRDNLSIRIINFSNKGGKDKIEKILGLEQFQGRLKLVDAEDRDFGFQKEALKIAYDRNVERFVTGADIIIKDKKVYFEGKEFEIIPSFDVFLSSLLILCGKDRNFLKFLKEFLDTLPKEYKVFDSSDSLVEIILPAVSEELITREFLKKLKEINDTSKMY